jgi:hypothetical protein
MVELREDRPGWIWLGIGIIVVMAVVWALVPLATDWRVRQECRGRYAAAKAREDSAKVDAYAPVATRHELASPITCGGLRAVGRLA